MGKNRRYQPNRTKLDKAMSDILDKAVNADSANAPKQLRNILLTENPQWKLPERRVARYLKRHLKARKNPIADEIEADMDEETVYTLTSNAPSSSVVVHGGASSSSLTSGISSPSLGPVPVPVPADDPEPAPVPVPEPVPVPAPDVKVENEAYAPEEEIGTKKEAKPLFCDGLQCVIS
jgi:hypothetical protein